MPQISPGGLGVDFLRSCYRTFMRFSHDSDAPLVPVRWRRCAPGTPLIPYPTPFVSRIWDANQAVDLPEALGEVGPRVWDDGGPTTRQWLPGFFGTEAQWRDGLEYPTDWGEPGIFGPTPWACPGFDPSSPWPCSLLNAAGVVSCTLAFPGWPAPYPPGPLVCLQGPECTWFGLQNIFVPVFPFLYQTSALVTVNESGDVRCELGSNQGGAPGLDIVYTGLARLVGPNLLRVASAFNPLALPFPPTVTMTWQR